MGQVESYRPFEQPWLQMQGLDPSKESNQSQQIFTDETKNPVLGTGSYDIDAKPPKSDTIEFKNQRDIFAHVNAGKNDTVKLDGDGWQKVDDRPLPGTPDDDKDGHEVYINKKNNSAVTINGGAKVELGGNNERPADTPATPVKPAANLFSALQLIFSMLGKNKQPA